MIPLKSQYIIHDNVVADAAGHNEEVENLMGTKIFMPRIKDV